MRQRNSKRRDEHDPLRNRSSSLLLLFFSSSSHGKLLIRVLFDLWNKGIFLLRYPLSLDHAVVDPGDGDEVLRSRGGGGGSEERVSKGGRRVKDDVGSVGESCSDERSTGGISIL